MVRGHGLGAGDREDAILEAAQAKRAAAVREALLGVRLLRMRINWRLQIALLLGAGVLGLLFYSHALTLLGATRVTMPAMLVVLGASLLSSIAGFAFSALCGALLLHMVDSPVTAVQIMLISSIGIQSLSVCALRHVVDGANLKRTLVGGMVGLPIGLWLLLHLDRLHYAHVLGVVLLVYGGWMLLWRAQVTWRPSWQAGVIAGLLGGITGGMAALPGPFVTIWCSLQGWDKQRQRGIVQPYILIMQVVSLATLYLMGSGGVLRSAIDPSAWTYLPAALLGTVVGLQVFRRMSDRQFALTVNTLLVASGVGLLA